MDALHGRLLNVWRKSLTVPTQECFEGYWTSHGGSTPKSSYWTATYHPSRKLLTFDEPGMQETAGEVGTGSLSMYFWGPLHMNAQRQEVQLEPTYSSSVPKTCWKQWTIGRGGERRQRDLQWWHIYIYIYIYIYILNSVDIRVCLFCLWCVQVLVIWLWRRNIFRKAPYLSKVISASTEVIVGGVK